MATYASLTTEQKDILQHFVNALVRPAMGEVARMENHLSALNDDYNVQSSAIMALLDSDAVIIPNESGLSGTASLTKGEVITLVSYAQGILGYNTSGHRQNYVKAAGAENTIG